METIIWDNINQNYLQIIYSIYATFTNIEDEKEKIRQIYLILFLRYYLNTEFIKDHIKAYYFLENIQYINIIDDVFNNIIHVNLSIDRDDNSDGNGVADGDGDGDGDANGDGDADGDDGDGNGVADGNADGDDNGVEYTNGDGDGDGDDNGVEYTNGDGDGDDNGVEYTNGDGDDNGVEYTNGDEYTDGESITITVTEIQIEYFINLFNDFEDVKIVLNENDLNDIPEKKYSEISTELNTCSICQDELSKDNIIRQLNCSHIYHKECIDKYLLEYSNKCPICRAECRKTS
jgi:hypothetical protein